MNKKIFARIISVTLVIGVILATCLTLFACDRNKTITVEDVFKSSNSKSEFTSYKLEISLPAGWSVYTSSGTGSQSASHNSDVGYIESINAFVVQKNGVLSIVKMNDERIYFDGGIKGMIFPEWIGVSAVRVKDGLVLCKFASGEAGVLTVNGETVTTYLADVDDLGDYVGETEAISDGVFLESFYRSAPYFDLDIDGITNLDA